MSRRRTIRRAKPDPVRRPGVARHHAPTSTYVFDPIILLALLAGGWYWMDSIAARDAALAAALKACQRAQVQLLDHTVARERIRLMRNPSGRLSLCRVYTFEFATDGWRRYRGVIALLGRRVVEVEMEPDRVAAED